MSVNIKAKKFLIMGLPGAGKTTLANKLATKIISIRINADEVRKKYNDWDFSEEGRDRQAKRMRDLSDQIVKSGKMLSLILYVQLIIQEKILTRII